MDFKHIMAPFYHSKYDSTFYRMNGMNYPFGEMVYFTGCQPLIVNSIKFISAHFVDVSNHSIGIMNIITILSIMLAAIFLFLFFFDLGVPWWYAAVVSTGICMLSPQIGRLGGHFSLSYLFWLPLMIYLVLQFDKSKSYKSSVAIGIATYFAAATHFYFVALYGFLIGGYWFVFVLQNFGSLRKWMFFVLNFTVQFILPFAIISLLISLNDSVVDRTDFPYGFYAYKAHPAGIFLPGGYFYSFVPRVFTVLNHVPWESFAFIGTSSLVCFLFGMALFFKKLFRGDSVLKVTDNHILNVMFWSSFGALLFSFGIPFIFGLEKLVDLIGPIRQLRALARFSWLFFYLMNILTFYLIYKKIESGQTKYLWRVVFVVALFFLFYEGYRNMSFNSGLLENRSPQFEDRENTSKENEWVVHIKPQDFQAILPLPFFHVGSENIWIESKDNMAEKAMYVSLKTGLPMMSAILSRTSITQSYMNYALATEPLEAFSVLGKLPNEKPLLVVFNKASELDENQKRILDLSQMIYSSEAIEFRKLPIQKLRDLHSNYHSSLQSHFLEVCIYPKDNCLVSDTTTSFIYKGFDDKDQKENFKGAGAFNAPSKQWNVLYEGLLNNKGVDEKFIVSFWVKDYAVDGMMRANYELIVSEPESNLILDYIYSDFHRHIVAFEGGWALVQFTFETKCVNEKIKVSIRNNILPHHSNIIDELLIRHAQNDILFSDDEFYFCNTRKFLK